MSELRGRLLVDGRLVPGTVAFAEGHITQLDLEPDAAAAELPIIAPGLVDLHVHGYGGAEPVDDLAGMATALARAGTTAFQPTLFPEAPAKLGATAERLWAEAEKLESGARVVGLHLEGPFVNPDRAGALQHDDLAEPSVEALRAILGPATGAGRGVRTVTLAPELAGSNDLIAELVRCGVRVSLGHSLATAAETHAAARAGAVGATHLFNAMPPLHHREVGLAGAALLESTLFAELIGDLVHVGPDAIELALAARGPGGLCLVSDALSGAGSGCDVFHCNGREHVVRDGAAWWSDSPNGGRESQHLGGSATGQLDQVRLLVARGVVGVEDALTMASATPADALGLAGELGAITIGARADLLELAGPDLRLERVWVGGAVL